MLALQVWDYNSGFKSNKLIGTAECPIDAEITDQPQMRKLSIMSAKDGSHAGDLTVALCFKDARDFTPEVIEWRNAVREVMQLREGIVVSKDFYVQLNWENVTGVDALVSSPV